MDMNPKFAAAAAPQKHRPRVFVVDDALVVRNLVIECLEEEIPGLEVAGFAGSEETALTWLRSNPCDVVIVDLELRQGTGLGLLKRLSALDSTSNVVKIVYSNHTDELSRRAAKQLGATHFLDKMHDTDKLHSLLRDIASSGE